MDKLLLLAAQVSAHELCITLDIIKVQHMEHHRDGHVQVDHGLEGEDVPLSTAKL